LCATVLENQIYHHGAGSTSIRQRVQEQIGELFYPSSPAWRWGVLHAADQAFNGIFTEFGLLKKA
jgi:hypothetical protein